MNSFNELNEPLKFKSSKVQNRIFEQISNSSGVERQTVNLWAVRSNRT